MRTQSKKLTQGFTIIEVLIVLAIAGLIMAIIFLAVPALQRNSRNNSRSNDAAHLAGLVNDYAANHAGTLPTQVGTGNNQLNLSGENWAIVDDPATGDFSSAASNTAPWGDADTLVVRLDKKCAADTNQLSDQTRAFSITYQVETSGAATNRCLPG